MKPGFSSHSSGEAAYRALAKLLPEDSGGQGHCVWTEVAARDRHFHCSAVVRPVLRSLKFQLSPEGFRPLSHSRKPYAGAFKPQEPIENCGRYATALIADR